MEGTVTLIGLSGIPISSQTAVVCGDRLPWNEIQGQSQLNHTFLSLKVDLDPGGYLEDLGLILEVLGVMVSTI